MADILLLVTSRNPFPALITLPIHPGVGGGRSEVHSTLAVDDRRDDGAEGQVMRQKMGVSS